MRWITDEHYAEELRTEAEPYLEARREAGFHERVPGQPIYFEHCRADEPRGVVVISHGFTESAKKFEESIFYLLQAGYETWIVEHRGHGRSYRPNDNPFVVHVDRFDDYVDDLRHLVETRVKPAAGELPLFLFCHSMGGCVGVRLIEGSPELFRKAVLSSPMLGLSFGKIPLPVAYTVARLKSRGEGAKQPLTPVTAFPEERYADSAGNSEPRFDWYYAQKLAEPRFQTCAPSAGWGREAIRACRLVQKEAGRVKIPVLLFQAGADVFVKNAAQDEFAARVPSCEIRRMPGKRHELYVSDTAFLKGYWEQIFAFLES